MKFNFYYSLRSHIILRFSWGQNAGTTLFQMSTYISCNHYKYILFNYVLMVFFSTKGKQKLPNHNVYNHLVDPLKTQIDGKKQIYQ